MGSICCRSMVIQVGVSLFCPFFFLMTSSRPVVKRTTLPHEKHLTGTGKARRCQRVIGENIDLPDILIMMKVCSLL